MIPLTRRWRLSPWTGCRLQILKYSSKAVLVTALILLFCSSPVALASDPVWNPLMDRLISDGFAPQYIRSVFAKAELTFDPQSMARKINALLAAKNAQTAKPGKALQPKVQERYLNPILLAGAYAYLRENKTTLNRIETRYGVPDTIIVAVYLVETKLGRTIGRYKAFEILANMALGGDYALIKDELQFPDHSADLEEWAAKRTRQKGMWAYEELAALLRYAQSAKEDPTSIPGSVYGAIGLCQFMPTTALHYAQDGNGDGTVDLFNEQDALFSIASFLKEHGWKPGLSLEMQKKVVYRYNHSTSYALTVLEVADRLQRTDNFFGRD